MNFLNADLIAAGLSPFQPESAAFQAGRIMLQEMARLTAERASFTFETTLSGRSYLHMIRKWQQGGYHVELVFLKLRSVTIALRRVKSRVLQGGHSIPAEVVRRRYRAGWSNFENLYRPLVNEWSLYDNSGTAPELIEQGGNS